MSELNRVIKLAIIQNTSAQRAAVYGLVDLLNVANQFQRQHSNSASQFNVEVIKTPIAQRLKQHQIVVLPPAITGPPSGEELTNIANILRQQHEAGALLCSVCAGTFPLAASGVLENRTATTHWALADDFARQHPNVALDIDKLIVDDGDVITAGGLMAWVDLGLRLVERVMGPSTMLETARFFLVDPNGREQRYYSNFSPRLNHGDAAVLKTQHWLQTQYEKQICIADMAIYSGLGKRTFSRRFLKATGLNASEYLQALRIGKAREMMEFTPETVDTIAYKVGYEDTSAFRKVFFKLIGLTPREYRKRFGTQSSTQV